MSGLLGYGGGLSDEPLYREILCGLLEYLRLRKVSALVADVLAALEMHELRVILAITRVPSRTIVCSPRDREKIFI